ncbi:uncharacterized protein LOC135497906 [Lineus longissimus]|uniref:uncharacterized protein LOC135497906 n=1 Tax=Lineus longissimus TaxID=88925 RepID=UPI002B4CB1C9
MASFFSLCAVLLCTISMVAGHGRLIKPPSRSSAWRYGFSTPANYNDHELFCGGFGVQYGKNGGKCGICGDPWQGQRANEAGGIYATGTIVGKYQQGETIDIEVELTANHLGWFEFKVCPNNDYTKAATQECLDKYPIFLPEAGSNRMKIGSRRGVYKIKGKLPEGLTCTQCVFQWIYNTGNSWGTDPQTGRGCLGCGNQEQFRGCADISIS